MNIVRDSPPEGIIRNGVQVPVHSIGAEKRKKKKERKRKAIREKRKEKNKRFIKDILNRYFYLILNEELQSSCFDFDSCFFAFFSSYLKDVSLHCTVTYCTVLHCNVLHRTTL